MDEFLLEAAKKYGMSGIISLFIIWDKFIYPQWKKSQGNFVSYKDLKEQLEKLEGKVSAYEVKLSAHLDKEAQEDIVLAKMQSEQDHFKEEFKDFKENQKAIFAMISDIKNILIQKGL